MRAQSVTVPEAGLERGKTFLTVLTPDRIIKEFFSSIQIHFYINNTSPV